MTERGWQAFPADCDSLPEIMGYIMARGEAAKLSDEDMTRLKLGSEEAVVNIASYAYPEGDGSLWVRAERDAEMFTLNLVDWGIPFDPFARDTAPADDISIEEAEPGGLGIFFVRQSFDEVSYRREMFQAQMANHLILSLRPKKPEAAKLSEAGDGA